MEERGGSGGGDERRLERGGGGGGVSEGFGVRRVLLRRDLVVLFVWGVRVVPDRALPYSVSLQGNKGFRRTVLWATAQEPRMVNNFVLLFRIYLTNIVDC